MKARASQAGTQTDPVPAEESLLPDNADLLQLLAHLSALTAAIEHDLQQRFGSSLAEFEILDALRQRPLPQSDLCRRNHRGAPVISRCVKRLADQGYAASHPPRHDRRERIASLLKRGVNQHQRIRAHLAGLLLQLAQELTPTLEAHLFRLHQKVCRFAANPPAADRGQSTEL